jgi:hypothetical protein
MRLTRKYIAKLGIRWFKECDTGEKRIESGRDGPGFPRVVNGRIDMGAWARSNRHTAIRNNRAGSNRGQLIICVASSRGDNEMSAGMVLTTL